MKKVTSSIDQPGLTNPGLRWWICFASESLVGSAGSEATENALGNTGFEPSFSAHTSCNLLEIGANACLNPSKSAQLVWLWDPPNQIILDTVNLQNCNLPPLGTQMVFPNSFFRHFRTPPHRRWPSATDVAPIWLDGHGPDQWTWNWKSRSLNCPYLVKSLHSPQTKKKRPHCPQAKPEMQNYTVSVVRGSPVPVWAMYLYRFQSPKFCHFNLTRMFQGPPPSAPHSDPNHLVLGRFCWVGPATSPYISHVCCLIFPLFVSCSHICANEIPTPYFSRARVTRVGWLITSYI